MKALLFVCALVCYGAPAARQHAASHSAKAKPISVDAINNTSLNEEVTSYSSGAATLRAEILLDRAHFSPGQIESKYTNNLGRAIAAYREANQLSANADVDAEMWAKLNADTAPALQQYTITPEDVAGPYTPRIPASMMAQAKLPALNFRNPQEGLGEKFHCDPKLLEDLNPGKDITQAGTQIVAPNVIVTPPTAHAAQVTVSKDKGVVEALDDGGKVIACYPATMGSEHDPLPIGNWEIVEVKKFPYFHYNAKLFWDAKDKNAKATLKPGPNSPVGVVWMGLSKEHYGIHGTENPGNIGLTQSHGCIRLTNWDAMELSDMVSKGTPVVLKEN